MGQTERVHSVGSLVVSRLCRQNLETFKAQGVRAVPTQFVHMLGG
jgi:hypothetical protein